MGPRTPHDAADLDRRVTHVSVIDPHHPLFGTRLRISERHSCRGEAVVVLILADGRERSVPRAATDLADDPILHSSIHRQARISMRSLLPLANHLRIMLRCQDEDCGGEALPGRWPAPSACSGTDPAAGTGATVVVRTALLQTVMTGAVGLMAVRAVPIRLLQVPSVCR
ncbi:MAG: DUF5372 family protein [Pigmentiphaga sp.]